MDANGVGGVRLRSFAPPDCEQGVGPTRVYRKIQRWAALTISRSVR